MPRPMVVVGPSGSTSSIRSAPMKAPGLPGVPVGPAAVDADNRGGATQATRHLLALGRRRIATITGPQDMIAGVDRYAGHRDALEEAGHAPAPELVAHGDFTEAGGARAMAELLERVPGLDAVLVASGPMAVGALRALRVAGRRVPA